MKGQFIWTKLKVITVEPILFLYMLIIFLESNALLELIFVKACIKRLNPVNISDCSYSHKDILIDIEDEATYWTTFNGAFLFCSTFISSLFVASWTDKLGRKIAMIIPPLGTAIAASINCVLSVFLDAHIAYFFISATISGLTFGSVGIIASTFGFISDITDQQSRTKRIVILEAMTFIGGTVGIYIGGQFLQDVDYEYKLNSFARLFIFELVLAIVIWAYTILRIPGRTIDKEHPPVLLTELFKFTHVKDSLKAVFRARSGGKRKVVLLLLLALFFIYFATVVQFTLAYYYVKTLGWSFKKYSNFNSMQFASEGVALLIGLPIVFHFFYLPDHIVVILGLISRTAGSVIFGLSSNDAMVYSCVALFMFAEFPVPAIRSMLSKTVDIDEKGRIFAFTTILQNICYLIGSLVLTSVFRATENIFPGLCFEVVAALQVMALVIIGYLYFTKDEMVTTYEIMENEDGSIEESCNVVSDSGSIN